MSNQYYSLKKILKHGALYNVIIGKRSNGKTYAWKKRLIEKHFKEGHNGAYIRRFAEDVRPKYISQLFDVHNEDIEILSKGRWNATTYKSNGFYFCIKTEDGVVDCDTDPFCKVYCLNTWESQKGADNGFVESICFDEFMTRKAYLPNEFIIFTNILSSIIRDRDGTTIFMLANTVNKFCPYFKEMGLTHVPEMKPGDIELYTFGESELTVAVEMCPDSENTKKVSKYFAFDNPQLDMITKGSWEIAMYPHLSDRFTKEDIVKRFYIIFDNNIICGDIIQSETYLFIHYHEHTSNYKPTEKDIVYLETHDGLFMHSISLHECQTDAHKLIARLIKYKREFYSNNSVGEVVRNWKLNALRIL